LAARIREAFPGATTELVPGGRGDFVVTVDGERVWDKRAMEDEFPDEERLVARLRARTPG